MSWSFADFDGFFSGRVYSGPEEALPDNTPNGYIAIPGEYDARRYCWDFLCGEAAEFMPLKPEDTEFETYKWDEQNWNWSPVPTRQALAAQIREKRNAKLRACDWVTLRAFRTATPIPPEWGDYMQALADIPLQPGFPEEVIWPVEPE